MNNILQCSGGISDLKSCKLKLLFFFRHLYRFLFLHFLAKSNGQEASSQNQLIQGSARASTSLYAPRREASQDGLRVNLDTGDTCDADLGYLKVKVVSLALTSGLMKNDKKMRTPKEWHIPKFNRKKHNS